MTLHYHQPTNLINLRAINPDARMNRLCKTNNFRDVVVLIQNKKLSVCCHFFWSPQNRAPSLDRNGRISANRKPRRRYSQRYSHLCTPLQWLSYQWSKHRRREKRLWTGCRGTIYSLNQKALEPDKKGYCSLFNSIWVNANWKRKTREKKKNGKETKNYQMQPSSIQ